MLPAGCMPDMVYSHVASPRCPVVPPSRCPAAALPHCCAVVFFPSPRSARRRIPSAPCPVRAVSSACGLYVGYGIYSCPVVSLSRCPVAALLCCLPTLLPRCSVVPSSRRSVAASSRCLVAQSPCHSVVSSVRRILAPSPSSRCPVAAVALPRCRVVPPPHCLVAALSCFPVVPPSRCCIVLLLRCRVVPPSRLMMSRCPVVA